MKPELAVVCDQLRTLGLEDVARWVEHPEAVRELLKSSFGASRRGDGVCCDHECHAMYEESAHAAKCATAAAWRALGDPRGQADIERAHEEALHVMANMRTIFGTNIDAASYDLWRHEGPRQELTMVGLTEALRNAAVRR